LTIVMQDEEKELDRWCERQEYKLDHAQWEQDQREKFEAMDRYDESGYWRHFR